MLSVYIHLICDSYLADPDYWLGHSSELLHGAKTNIVEPSSHRALLC